MPSEPLVLPLPELAEQFLLRRDVTFLNHGSFGACPRPVFEVYQSWQRELEAQPVDFFGRRRLGLLADARAALGALLGVHADTLVYAPNVSYALNYVIHSLRLQPGDEILTTDHEYGAVDRAWTFHCERQGARLVHQPISLPISSTEQVIEQFWSGVTDRTRVIAISHITSPTALIFPVAEICRRARAAGIMTVVDGAHAPGQIALNLEAIGADFYGGNCHKWLCAPKGAGFLYARPERQELLEPLMVGWGWRARQPRHSSYLDYFEQTGTDDPAAYLSVPAAIAFQREHDWPRVRAACHTLVREARRQVADLTGLEPICPDSLEWFVQMATLPLPPACEPRLAHLWERYRIEIPIIAWNDRLFVRISIQAYNSPADVERLLTALSEIVRG